MLIFRRFNYNISLKNSTHEMHIGIFCINKTSHFFALLSLICHDSESHTSLVTKSFFIEQGESWSTAGDRELRRKNPLHTELYSKPQKYRLQQTVIEHCANSKEPTKKIEEEGKRSKIEEVYRRNNTRTRYPMQQSIIITLDTTHFKLQVSNTRLLNISFGFNL